ncbi:MAG: putative exosortase B-associated extracellular polysaccharide biosynthesis transporter EpsL, partial [Candidatus Thermoplasmatota archaeon]|nr:putative exosortase B-associated extracellular polysaccharide biosynthesis transporter EpsL [Candidatus Thermoplasmatota archaeon]
MALTALPAVPAQAKEGDTFQPFVSYTRYYDSNLFRLAGSEYALVPHLSDQYGVLSAGVNADWQPGRQRVIASASKSLVRYSRNPQLDYDGSDHQLKWNWRLGNHWSGQVGATESVAQSSFSDLVGLLINNQVTRKNRFANAEWQFHPRWHAGLGAATASSTNSTTQRASSDYEDISAYATLGYTTPKGSKLRGQLRRVEGEYPNRSAGLFADRAYTLTEYNLLGDWNMSGKLIAHARLGYVQRENDTLSQRNFSGLAGRLSADYFPSGKTALNWALYREIANSDDVNASYQLSAGTRLGAAWLATSRVTLRASASFENRSFEGDTGFILPGTPQRDEDTLSGSLSLSYAPLRMATIDVGVQAGRRESNIPVND